MWARLMKVSRTLGGAGAVVEMGLAVVGGRAPSVSFDSALRAALGMTAFVGVRSEDGVEGSRVQELTMRST